MPTPKYSPFFGEKENKHVERCGYFEWPTLEIIMEMWPWKGMMKLENISVRKTGFNTLHSVKINLTNGVSSPWLGSNISSRG